MPLRTAGKIFAQSFPIHGTNHSKIKNEKLWQSIVSLLDGNMTTSEIMPSKQRYASRCRCHSLGSVQLCNERITLIQFHSLFDSHSKCIFRVVFFSSLAILFRIKRVNIKFHGCVRFSSHFLFLYPEQKKYQNYEVTQPHWNVQSM